MLGLIGALLAPDLDILAGPLLSQPLLHYHNGISHSLLLGLVFGALFGVACRLIAGRGLVYFALLGVAAFATHVVLDACCWGQGVMMFWPLSDVRVMSPVYLFLGVRHSCDAPWYLHVLTVANEAVFAALVWGGMWLWQRRGRSGPARLNAAGSDLAESSLGN